MANLRDRINIQLPKLVDMIKQKEYKKNLESFTAVYEQLSFLWNILKDEEKDILKNARKIIDKENG